MRRPLALFWLWLVYSGLLTWCSHGQVSAQSRRGVTESPFMTTTDNPSYVEAYDDDTEFESVTTDETVPPATTLKTGRNYGSRIRGINSLPYGPNSVVSNNETQAFLRPRPTSSVISYNPTNYNRVLKRRKNSTITTPSSLLTYNKVNLLQSTNGSSSSYGGWNRTRNVNNNSLSNNNSNTLSTRQTFNSSSQQNSSGNGGHKILMRKRPRPVTVNDLLSGTTTTTTAAPSTSEAPPPEVETTSEPETTSQPPAEFSIPDSNASSSSNTNLLTRPKLRTGSSRVIPGLANAVEAEPVSLAPVSAIPSFEFNPSVSVQDGVYRFRYSEPTYSSKRVHSEDFGVSHVSYGHDDEEPHEEDEETTTYAPPLQKQEDTTHPFQINIDGSEEEFTSSLPPSYKEYLSQEEQEEQRLENQSHRPPLPVRNVGVAPEKVESAPAVTVTVTHTILTGTSSPAPDHSAERDSNGQANTIPKNSHNNEPVVNVSSRPTEESQQENAIRPTPALPPLVSIQSSTSNLNGTDVNQSGEDLSSSASPTIPATLNNTTVINKNVIVPEEQNVINSVTNNQGHGQGSAAAAANNNNVHSLNESDSIPPNSVASDTASPSPTVSSKIQTSLYFTKEENPYFTTSSYSYTASTVYTYGTSPPDHEDEEDHFGHHHHQPHDDHDHHHDESSQEHHGHQHDGQHPPHPQDNASKEQELRPTTTAYWDSLGHKSASNPQLHSKYFDLNSTTRNNASSPDQELGYSTPEADTEFPPLGFGDRTTTPLPISEPDDHSVAENEIGDGDYPSTGHGEDDDGTVIVKNGTGKSGNTLPNNNDAESLLPTVPVFIQVLLDMPASVFCSSISSFKQMIARVYEPDWEVTPEQVIVFNEQGCNNSSKLAGTHHHHHPERRHNFTNSPLNHTGIIKFATTTATVPKTLPGSSTARSVVHRRRTPASVAPTTTTSSDRTLLSSTPTYSGIRLRNKRHSHDNNINKVELSRYDTTGPSENEINDTDTSEGITLYPVFFYLNNKNGSYDQLLTESFIQLWNVSKDTSDANQSMFFDKIRKVEMVTPSQGITGHAPDNENTGIIAAITIASIAAVCLFLLGVLLLVMRHRQSQSKFAKRCTPVSLDDYSLDNISVYNSFRRKQRNRASKRSYTNAAFDDPNAPSRPCNAAGITTAMGDITKLEDEFSDLPSVTPTMDDIPTGAETKNRYANVIPMPDTRVLLTFQEDVPNSDYINANYIRGPMGVSKGYIITQGPLDETIVDFWRMVWEQQVRVIMMLTDFSEAGIPKCAEYYPRSETVDSSQLHGDFQITLEKRDISENCITSYLVIKDMERNLRRDVIHLWYHSWPDKGVPTNPKCTLDFLLKSRKFTKEPTPVLVHCSPGTGRSGTLVACDIAMREFDTQHSVNIPRTVMKIRQDRSGSVQTKEQYLHIYQVLQSYALRNSGNQLDSI